MFVRVIFLVLCITGFLIGDAKAQLFLENAKVSLAVSDGEHLNGSVIIHNMSSEKGYIRVYWEDFEYKSPYDGSKNFLPAGTAPGSASRWVTFSPTVFTLPPMGQQKVDYMITVPSSGQEQGHYGVLFFEKSADPVKDVKEGVSIVTRVGCLFFIEPKNKNKKAVIQDLKVKEKDLTAKFVNQGNVVLIPRTTYYMMEVTGLVLFRGEAKKLYVPPGAAALLEIPFKEKLKQGHYTLVVNSDLEEGDVVVKEIGLVVDESGQITLEISKD